ncbi:MAG: hypothetical protein J5606_04980 [Bacteroidales bacterium]|nr:hypothetical protein [Bacteroidales bacterium]
MELIIGNIFLNILIYVIVLLNICALVFVVINEIRNANPKIKSFLWITGSLLIPGLALVYVIVVLVKRIKLQKQQM